MGILIALGIGFYFGGFIGLILVLILLVMCGL